MRNTCVVFLLFAVTSSAVPARTLAFEGHVVQSSSQSGSVNGVAKGSNQNALSHHRVQLRSLNTGELEGTTVTSDSGAFTFGGVPAGGHVVELVDPSGRVIGLSNAVAVNAGSVSAVTVVAAASAAPGASGAAHGHAGMPPGLGVAIAAVGSGAGAAGLAVAVKATQKNTASPSR
jgi:hypothetical protein